MWGFGAVGYPLMIYIEVVGLPLSLTPTTIPISTCTSDVWVYTVRHRNVSTTISRIGNVHISDIHIIFAPIYFFSHSPVISNCILWSIMAKFYIFQRPAIILHLTILDEAIAVPHQEERRRYIHTSSHTTDFVDSSEFQTIMDAKKLRWNEDDQLNETKRKLMKEKSQLSSAVRNHAEKHRRRSIETITIYSYCDIISRTDISWKIHIHSALLVKITSKQPTKTLKSWSNEFVPIIRLIHQQMPTTYKRLVSGKRTHSREYNALKV